MEGYFDPFDHIEEAYREAHDVLMELIKRDLLKIQENNVIAVEGSALNMIDSCLLGFNDTAALRLFSVFKDNESLGGVTRMNGMIKTLCNPKCWEENYTLLIDHTHLCQGDNQTFSINSMKELKVLAVFKAKCESPLISSLSEMDKLLVLVLRSCDLPDGITHINKLKTLKVLEISFSPISLPDELFDGMTDLQSLNLSGLQMKSLSSLSNLHELRSLILRQFSHLEEVESLKELVKLEILDLSSASSLKSMPSNLFDEITNLQSLNLSGLKLIESFPSFSKLSKLRVLMLKSCSCLQKLQSLRGLGELQILDISDSTSFESFEDKTLSVLPKIQMINLSRTNIQFLPEFSELRYLTQIFLSGCRNLHNLPTLQPLTSLQILDLSGAIKFETFKDQSIQDLDQLRILDVSKTSIIPKKKVTHVPKHAFIREYFRGIGKDSALLGWVVQYGFNSCIMGQVGYIVPRLIIGVIIQVLCSYSTLPLYAIVTQMGTSFKKEVFDEHVQVKISGWAKKVKEKKGLKSDTEGSTTHATSHGRIQLGKVFRNASTPEEIQSSQGADRSK
ncbi:hypothetical protein LWI29_033813 [Acer saccharum]|uniref:MLO-like protein n=1 Tax=Acer saccharum TaxID=4024 RepID=A0AA39T7V8_ACESA|nr:hypothetical protein LWI29_033813 [Acer saccharum]